MEEAKQQATEKAKRQDSTPVKLRTRIVCWYCKCSHRTLINLRDERGEKTEDYACTLHVQLGRPAIGNQSQIRFQYQQPEVAA